MNDVILLLCSNHLAAQLIVINEFVLQSNVQYTHQNTLG